MKPASVYPTASIPSAMISIVWIRSAGVPIGRTSPKPTPEIVITTMKRASNGLQPSTT